MANGPSIHDFSFQFHTVGGEELYFEPSDEDTSGATYKYYGFLSKEGAWLIMRFDLSTANTILYRYAAGKSCYATAWTTRATQTYSLFSDISPT